MIESLLEALKFSPDNIPLRLQIAKLYLQNGNTQEAEEHLLFILSKEPKHQEAKYNLAKCFYQQEKYGAAELLLEEILNQYKSIDALELLCYCYINQDELNDAQQTYQEILSLDKRYTNTDFDEKLKHTSTSKDSAFTDEDALSFIEKPQVGFEDVGGMEHIKREIDLKIIKPLQHQDIYKAYGKKIGGGILLYGPPGCGKTHLAKATAGQINADFINVGINEILDMWIGSSERNLHEIFETARANKPCVIFIDEIDALGANRNDMNKSAGRSVINQFLSELDGVDSDNDGILVLGATNAPWHLDPAFRRPGRFDRIIFVSPPDEPARESIFKIHLNNKPVEHIDYKSLAKASKNFSGADIQAVIDIAIEEKLEKSFEAGIPAPLKSKDLLKAIKKVKPSTKEWFSSAKNYALYANDAGLYDDVLNFLNIKK